MRAAVNMVWRQPKLRVETNEGVAEGVQYLEFEIINQPIHGGPLSWLRVERDTAKEIWANVEILEDGSSRLIQLITLAGLVRRGTGEPTAQRIPLPPSVFGAATIVVFRSLQTGQAVTVDTRNNTTRSIPPGRYIAVLTVIGLRRPHQAKRRFVVNADNTFLWLAD